MMGFKFEAVTKGNVVIDSIVVVYRPLMGSNENAGVS